MKNRLVLPLLKSHELISYITSSQLMLKNCMLINKLDAKAGPEEDLALPGFTDANNRLFYALSSEGIARCKRITCVVGYAYPEITYCPMLLPVASLFLHFIPV